MRSKMWRWGAIGLFMAAAMSTPVFLNAANGNSPFVMTNIRQDPRLSLMTYNVEGLPWPVRFDRDEDLSQIQTRLETLRLLGEQPHIVVLQEAFTDAAKSIGPESGYRYVAYGPDKTLAGAPAVRPDDRAFAASASLLRGERSGKLVDSGLQILSDYPILSVRRMAFPSYACAGFDCLANKGVVLAMIAVPGIAEPIAVANVHLNSRRASHVSDERSIYAYRRQIDALDAFLTKSVKPGTPVIVAGDFNVGKRPTRKSYFQAFLKRWGSGMPGQGAMIDALTTCLSPAAPCGTDIPSDARYSAGRARDWQLSSAGSSHRLGVTRLSVPFGHDLNGRMLSDHVGYVAYYDVIDRSGHASGAAKI